MNQKHQKIVIAVMAVIMAVVMFLPMLINIFLY